MEHDLAMDSNRLFAAADALLEAMETEQGRNALIAVRLDDPAGHSHPTMRAFTPAELTDAMTLLMRLGLVPRALNRATRNRS